LREEHDLREFEKRMLRKKSGPFKLSNEEVQVLYNSSIITKVNKSRSKKWARSIARLEDNRNVHKISVNKPQGKR
jgi:hypothetical protein